MNNKLRSSGPCVNEPRWSTNEHYWNNYAVAGCALPVAVGSEATQFKRCVGRELLFPAELLPFHVLFIPAPCPMRPLLAGV